MEHKARSVLVRRNGIWAFIITVLLGYIQWVSSGIHSLSSFRFVVLICCGFIYVSFGIASTYLLSEKTKYIMWGYLLIEIAIGIAIIYLSEGTAWLVIFPLVSQVVIMLPGREAWLLNIVIFSSLLLVLGLSEEKVINWQQAFGLLCAMLFVILFSQIVLIEQKTRNEVEQLYVELSVANRKLQEYTIKVEELATVLERNRLARDIHDGLGHYLTALTMQIKAAQVVLDKDRTRALAALDKAINLAEGALSDVRNSVAALRSDSSLNHSLPDEIETLLSECRSQGLVVEFVTQGKFRVVEPHIAFTLYRVIQEALTNVRKHAFASRVDVTLKYETEQVHITVCDNGVGAKNIEGGFGLFGIHERIQSLHGRVKILTSPGEGFCIEMEVPG